MRIGFIGAGGIAGAHLSALTRISRDFSVTAVSDVVLERAEKLAGAHGACAFEDCRKMLDTVDAVYVCTPPSLHREHTVIAAEAGKHVFCEKPIATTLEDGEEMISVCKRAGVNLMIGFNQRFRPPFIRLREKVLSGQLGDLLSYTCTRLAWGLPDGYNWRTDPELLCGMTVESLSHDFDLIRWVTGEEIDRVYGGIRNSRPEPTGFDDNMVAALRLKGGGMGSFCASWSSPAAVGMRGVVGTRGSCFVEGPDLWTLRQVRWKTVGDDEEQIEEYHPDAARDMGYAAQSDHFVGSLLENEVPHPTGQDGLQALRISLAILDASRTGEVVTLARPRRE